MFLKGLDYFLYGTKKDSEEINDFVKFCKNNESSQGVLENSFFFKCIGSNVKINSGPLSNIILKSVLIEKNRLKGQVGNLKITLNKSSKNYCYPVW